MEQCPKCRKLSLEYDPLRSEWRCLWYACGYVTLAKTASDGKTRARRGRRTARGHDLPSVASP